MATKTIKALVNGTIQEIEVEVINSPEQPLSCEERLDALESKPVVATINLPVNGWSNNSQSISVSGITNENIVIITPAPINYSAYSDAGVYCSEQTNGNLTFNCAQTPEIELTVNVMILN